jgi:hypothetical protein
MLQANQLTGFNGDVSSGNLPTYLYDKIVGLSLTANLNFCLDAADPRCYTVGSEQWICAHATGNDYYLGSTSGADASDPTHHGTVGNNSLDTYFSFDGADYFTAKGTHTYQTPWHKNNGSFTILGLFYPNPTRASAAGLWGDAESVLNMNGVCVRVTAVGEMYTSRSNAVSGGRDIEYTVAEMEFSKWNFFGWSFDEATTTHLMRVNSAAESYPGANPSTDTNAEDYVNKIGATGVPNQYLLNGDRLIAIAGFSAALSDANMAAFYDDFKLRIPTMP